jgi:hypothetical protein
MIVRFNLLILWHLDDVDDMDDDLQAYSLPSIPTGRRNFRIGREHCRWQIQHKVLYSVFRNQWYTVIGIVIFNLLF